MKYILNKIKSSSSERDLKKGTDRIDNTLKWFYNKPIEVRDSLYVDALSRALIDSGYDIDMIFTVFARRTNKPDETMWLVKHKIIRDNISKTVYDIFNLKEYLNRLNIETPYYKYCEKCHDLEHVDSLKQNGGKCYKCAPLDNLSLS
jgi:hypothetical protein